MQLLDRKLSDIHPYPNNPRKNDGAVDAVAESIRQCGYVAPIIVDEDGVILAGHTRYKALRKLGHTEAEVIVKEGLTEDQKRKYRLLDNKTNELAGWDFELLAQELEELDFGDFDFGLGDFDTDLDLDVFFTDPESEEKEKRRSSAPIVGNGSPHEIISGLGRISAKLIERVYAIYRRRGGGRH